MPTSRASGRGRTGRPTRSRSGAHHVSLVAIPDAVASTLFGIYDVLNAFAFADLVDVSRGAQPPFHVEITGEEAGEVPLASGVPVAVQRPVDAIETTDIVIVPSLRLPNDGWRNGRYPRLVEWLRRMHDRGAVLCSACSGIFILAETGLWDGKQATVHYAYARAFGMVHPRVAVFPERVLVIAGSREELVSSGASTTWHDLMVYLIARFAGATSAQQVARMFAMQWHQDGLTPYIVFEGRTDHGDAEILRAQEWLRDHFSVAAPVDGMIRRSKLAQRTFMRRFTSATGLTPLAYVQRLRVEEAKRRLERTDAPVDEVSWKVGYEDAAFFRRLFRRITGMTPGAYRRRFAVPNFARSQNAS